MSAAEHQSRNVSSQSDKKSLNNPPQRPSLLKPPPRPAASPAEAQGNTEPTSERLAQPSKPPEAPKDELVDQSTEKVSFKSHPIAPPSEPMQYRAIGLIRGVYQPSEEQLNRGNILADDGAVIDSVLLGRVTSLIKKHINLENSHLWVVYPRTRQANEEDEENGDGALHLQIVGVWEPETLGLPGENPKTLEDKEEDQEASDTQSASESPEPSQETEVDQAAQPLEVPSDNYFSIRGEVLNYNEEDGSILVKIVQGAKRSGKPPKAFKLNVLGKISGKTVGYFWELEVERRGEELVLLEGRSIGIVPPKKKKKRGGKPPGPRRGRRPMQDSSGKPSKPTRSKDKPRIRPSTPVKSNPL